MLIDNRTGEVIVGSGIAEQSDRIEDITGDPKAELERDKGKGT